MYVVAIPSYNRSKEIIKKTLQTLSLGGIDKNTIHIFVADEEQEKLYMDIIPDTLYHKIIIGLKGIANQRVFISNYFNTGQYIISLDDDVEELQKLENNKLVKLENLDELFKKAYDILITEGLFMWGIYPVKNPFFMKDKITTDLKFIIGVAFGYINRKLDNLRPTAEGKEDLEQSILYYKHDGGVVRFNYITAKTKFNAVGGLGRDRLEMNKNAAELIKSRYPDITTIFQRKNGMSEIRLARRPRRFL